MKSIKTLLLSSLFFCASSFAHEKLASATYMGNEAVLITSSQSKVVFDPLFHNDFTHYQLVPEKMVSAMIKGEKPYDNIAAVFISHAHEDHFDARSMLAYLKAQPKTKLFAPQQAVDAIKALPGHEAVLKQLTPVALTYGGKPWVKKVDNLLIEAVRIPHSGWPDRQVDTENLVFRITLDDKATVLHMGDADPNDVHFKPLDAYWKQRQSHTAFPPYWFFYKKEFRLILDERINAKHAIGVHVPKNVPEMLKNAGLDYFSKPGETREIK